MREVLFHVQHVVNPLEANSLDDTLLVAWLQGVCEKESVALGELQYIFVDDEYLHKLNVSYLNHDTYTDILTFDLRDSKDSPIEGEIYISVDRVRENAEKFGSGYDNELKRVIVHGLLHLIGYDDHSDEEKKEMRAKESLYISLCC